MVCLEMDKLAGFLAQCASQLEQLKLQGERQEATQKEMSAKVGAMEQRLSMPSSSSTVSVPSATFTVPVAAGVDLNAAATVGQCMEL